MQYLGSIEDKKDLVNKEYADIAKAYSENFNLLMSEGNLTNTSDFSWNQGGVTAATGTINNSSTRIRTSVIRGTCDAMYVYSSVNDIDIIVYSYTFAIATSQYVGQINSWLRCEAGKNVLIPITKGGAFCVVVRYPDDSNIVPEEGNNIIIKKYFKLRHDTYNIENNGILNNNTVISGEDFGWVRGGLGTEGDFRSSEYVIRSAAFISTQPKIKFKFVGILAETKACFVYFYKEDETFIKRQLLLLDTYYVTPEDCYKIKFTYGNTAASEITITDPYLEIPNFKIEVIRDEYQELLKNMGYISFSLVKGVYKSNGTITSDSPGICIYPLLQLPVGRKIKIKIWGNWIYSVWQGDSATNIARTNKLINYDEILVEKPYVGFIFYKTDDEGNVVDVQPEEFNQNILLFLSDNTTSAEQIIHEIPENIGVLNVINRAYQMGKLTYVPVANLPTQVNTAQYPGYVPEGTTVEGVMYSSVRNEGLYVPQCVSFDTYMTALKNPLSYIYTKTEPAPHYNALTYYGAVCSSMVAWCYGIDDVIPTTISFDTYPGMEQVENQSPYGLKLGDSLNNAGNHIAIVTDITKNNKGIINYIEVVDQVNYSSHPMTRIRRLVPAGIQEAYFNRGYVAYRYHYIYKVPYTPSPWINLDNESAEPTWNHNLSPRRGENANWRPNETIQIDITDKENYTQYKLLKNNVIQATETLPSNDLIELTNLSYGSYKVCLTDGTNDSDFVNFDIINTNTSCAAQGNKQVLVNFSSNNGIPSSISFCVADYSDSDYKAVSAFHVLTDSEISSGSAIVEAPSVGNWLIKVMFKTNFGLYSGDFVNVAVT